MRWSYVGGFYSCMKPLHVAPEWLIKLFHQFFIIHRVYRINFSLLIIHNVLGIHYNMCDSSAFRMYVRIYMYVWMNMNLCSFCFIGYILGILGQGYNSTQAAAKVIWYAIHFTSSIHILETFSFEKKTLLSIACAFQISLFFFFRCIFHFLFSIETNEA